MNYTDKAAARIAYFGAIKMDDQGYNLVNITLPRNRALGHQIWRTYRPEVEGEERGYYLVTLIGGEWSCECAFRAENCTCKHISRIQMELRRIADDAAQADRDAQRWDNEADARAEAADALERYHSR